MGVLHPEWRVDRGVRAEVLSRTIGLLCCSEVQIYSLLGSAASAIAGPPRTYWHCDLGRKMNG